MTAAKEDVRTTRFIDGDEEEAAKSAFTPLMAGRRSSDSLFVVLYVKGWLALVDCISTIYCLLVWRAYACGVDDSVYALDGVREVAWVLKVWDLDELEVVFVLRPGIHHGGAFGHRACGASYPEAPR